MHLYLHKIVNQLVAVTPKNMFTYFNDCFAFAALQVAPWGGSGHSDQSASEGSGV